jgi:hypothetical protein
MLSEILAERKAARDKLEREARLGLTIGLALRYAWHGAVWVAMFLLVGVALVVYTTWRILFGSMGK